MPITVEMLLQMRDMLAEYSLSNATAARIAEADARCLKDGENKAFFEREAEQLRKEAAGADILCSAITQELAERKMRNGRV